MISVIAGLIGKLDNDYPIESCYHFCWGRRKLQLSPPQMFLDTSGGEKIGCSLFLYKSFKNFCVWYRMWLKA